MAISGDARGAGLSPSASSRVRTNASIGFAGAVPSLSFGTTTAWTGTSDQCGR